MNSRNVWVSLLFRSSVLLLIVGGLFSSSTDLGLRPNVALASHGGWAGCTTTAFVDVNLGDYFYDPVQYLCETTAVFGYQQDGTTSCPNNRYPCFRPYDGMRRDDVVRAVVQSEEHWQLLPDPSRPTFEDVPLDGYMSRYIETAVQKGIINGYAGDPNHYNRCLNPARYETRNLRYFRPCATVTRAQAMKIVDLAESWPAHHPGPTFQDVPQGMWAFNHIENGVAHGLITGYECGGYREPCDPQNRPYFRPDETLKRGQMSKIVYLMHQGNFRHNNQVYQGSNNWNHSTSTYTEPRGFLRGYIAGTNRYGARGEDMLWTQDALTWLQNGAHSSDIVFHAFLANTNSCPHADAVYFVNNFSAGIQPEQRDCQYDPMSPYTYEVRFRVAAPNITANAPHYYADIRYNDTVSEKGEINISNYYNDPGNRRKDDMRKLCFYNNSLGWLTTAGLCHQ